MKAGILFFVIAAVKDYLVAQNKLQTDGTVEFDNVNEDIELAKVIENCLKEHDVTVQTDVDKVINAAPLILGVLGIN